MTPCTMNSNLLDTLCTAQASTVSTRPVIGTVIYASRCKPSGISRAAALRPSRPPRPLPAWPPAQTPRPADACPSSRVGACSSSVGQSPYTRLRVRRSRQRPCSSSAAPLSPLALWPALWTTRMFCLPQRFVLGSPSRRPSFSPGTTALTPCGLCVVCTAFVA